MDLDRIARTVADVSFGSHQYSNGWNLPRSIWHGLSPIADLRQPHSLGDSG